MRAPARLSYGRIPNLVELKDLIATQLESFNWFKSEGLRELFDEINPAAKALPTVKSDRKRRVRVPVLHKALELPSLKGTENDREPQTRALMEIFGDVNNTPEPRYRESTLEKNTTNKAEDALLEL